MSILREKASKSPTQAYFPEGTDKEIKHLILEYVHAHRFMYTLAGSHPEFEIVKAAQKGFTVINGSFVFRVLLDYKGEEGQIAMNFPNWRGWEEVLPLEAENHFTIGQLRLKGRRYEHGYYHSFKFDNKEEFINFFKKYVEHHPVER